jgi:hypothetical protein
MNLAFSFVLTAKALLVDCVEAMTKTARVKEREDAEKTEVTS